MRITLSGGYRYVAREPKFLAERKYGRMSVPSSGSAAGLASYRELAMLDAAETLFLEKGFERASVGEVIRMSGGSLATLYAAFGSKEGLLAAVVERRLEASIAEMTAIAKTSGTPAEVLYNLARSLAEFVGAPEGRSMLKLLVGASLHDPGLGQRFHDGPWDLPASILAPILEEWTSKGWAKVEHPLEAARLFWAMVLVDIPINTLLGMTLPPLAEDVLRRRVAPFIHYFLIPQIERAVPPPNG